MGLPMMNTGSTGQAVIVSFFTMLATNARNQVVKPPKPTLAAT